MNVTASNLYAAANSLYNSYQEEMRSAGFTLAMMHSVHPILHDIYRGMANDRAMVANALRLEWEQVSREAKAMA